MKPRSNWSREEHILAFSLYNQIPFGQIDRRNPKVVELATILERSPGSVALKLVNFARLDPVHRSRGVSGMSHGAKGEEDVWHQFANEPEFLAFESQRLMAERLDLSVEEYAEIPTEDLPAGADREALVRVRVNQSFFRRRVLSAYGFRCCITNLAYPQMLVASHIVPWSRDTRNRLNPRNGLCLNAIHDRAFDCGLLWIDAEMRVRIKPELREPSQWGEMEPLLRFEGQPLHLPKGFFPDPAFLAWHEKEIAQAV